MDLILPVTKYDLRSNEMTWLSHEKSWRKNSRMWGDKTHRICSYVAMFPPTLANYFINEFSEEGDIVLDTFSGRGTTLLESRLLNRKALAIDLNPFAYILSKSKSRSFKIEEVLLRLKEWESEYNKYSIESKDILDKSMKTYYSNLNLRQLTFIKNRFGTNWKKLDTMDCFILSICLGIMHGPMRKNGETIYLSLNMSNCISMSENYVKNYAKKHNLKKPKDNIFKKIENRISYILKTAHYSNNEAIVKYGNSLEIGKHFENIKPKLIFTSPPYLNIINYTQQNWIKMWLLGFETKDSNKNLKLDDSHGISEYVHFMSQYLESVSKIMSEDTTLALVIGDVHKTDNIYSFEDMWNYELKDKFKNLDLVQIYTDYIQQTKKATNSMGRKAGKATRVDKIYLFKIKK